MEIRWYKEALFSGMSSNAFKLGTVLTLGWFWFRISGCNVLYRGLTISNVDFNNILILTETGVQTVTIPSYLSHENDTTYFYVVRKANKCGDEEKTLSASTKVQLDSNGDLTKPEPNNIYEFAVQQISKDKIELMWFYCPLEQRSEPVWFKIYTDNGTGQIDYQNPLSTIDYIGRKFYTYKSQSLATGKYLFAIRVENSEGIDDNSLAIMKIELKNYSPSAIEILNTSVI